MRAANRLKYFLNVLAILVAAFYPLALVAQSEEFPQLHRGTARTLSISDNLPTGCFEQMIIDSVGRMWLTTCGDAQRNRRLHLLQYDGFESDHHNLGLPPGSTVILGGFLNDSLLFGVELTYNSAFIYNIYSRKTKITHDSSGIYNFYNAQVINGRSILLAFKDGTHYILELLNGQLIVHHVLEGFLDQPIIYLPGILSLAEVIDDAVWFTDQSSSVHRFDFGVNELETFKTPDGQPLTDGMLMNWKGKLVISFRRGKEFDVYTVQEDQLIHPDLLPKGWKYSSHDETLEKGSFLFADQAGWLFVNCEDSFGQAKTLLINQDGKTLDYSLITDHIGNQDYGWLYSPDFTTRLYVYRGETEIIEVSGEYNFEVHYTNPARALEMLDEQNIICLTDREPVIIPLGGDGELKAFSINPSVRKVVRIDKDRGLWFIDSDTIRRKDLNGKEHFDFPWHTSIDLFELYGDSLFFISQEQFYWLLPATKEVINLKVSIPKEEVFGYPNQLTRIGNNIWVATSTGLWKLNLIEQRLENVRLLSDQNFPLLSILSDNQGSLWLGTESKGVIQYNLGSGETSSIDRYSGLSHNTVVGLLKDNDENIWANTFNGISVLNQSGEVIATFDESDGLIENEGNRWSAMSLPDGRMAFGTVYGITIIQPQEALKIYQHIPKPRVYLRSISYEDRVSNQHVSISNPHPESAEFLLPFDRRTMQVDLGVSDIIASERNEYAYRIVLPGYDWISMGNQHKFVVTNLPYGKYNVQIRGRSGLGIWSANIAGFSLDVARPFYKTILFYGICATLFIGLIGVWMLRNRRERQRLEIEVKRRTEQIANQAEELVQLDKAKTRIYTNITHEFRTPLTIINGAVESMDDQKPEKGIIKRNSMRLLNLVNQMLELSKLQSGKMLIKSVQVNMAELIREVFEAFIPIANEQDIGMHFYVEPGDYSMDCDIEIMHRIFGNLMSNAIKFTPSGGNVYVRVDRITKLSNTKETLMLSVRDTGIGIPEEEMEKIFHRFHQAEDRGIRAGEGTGIGLALTHELVDLLKGTIEVKSKVDQGSEFVVCLPIHHEAKAGKILGEQPFIETPAIHQQGTGADFSRLVNANEDLPSVLITEDNPDIIHYLMNCLKQNYMVHIATDGQEGIDSAIQNVPDLIISDVMMPIKDGIQLCTELKIDERTSHIPIILLTAKADIESKLEGLQRGADAYMTKPFEKEELLLVIKNLIETRDRLRKRYTEKLSPDPTLDPNMQIEDAFMGRLNALIEEHLEEEDFGVLQLSRLLKYSRAQIHNKVKALTGISTSAYLQKRRMLKAEQLLTQGKMNISEVAYAVGFKDPNYFSRVFKRELGQTPTDYIHKEE